MKAISPDRFVRGDYANMEYRVTPVEGTSIDDLLVPSYWTHLAKTLRRFDRIVAVPDDEGWYATLIVLETGIGFARTALLFHVLLDMAGEELPEESPVEVKFKGPHLKHAVIRKADGQILVDKIAKRTEAEDWARDYVSRVAA